MGKTSGPVTLTEQEVKDLREFLERASIDLADIVETDLDFNGKISKQDEAQYARMAAVLKKLGASGADYTIIQVGLPKTKKGGSRGTR